MLNEFLFFLTIFLNFGGILLAWKYFGRIGLFSWMAFATVMANIEVVKCVDIFTLSLTLGNVVYGTTFLITDILNEKYGGAEARKAVYIGFCSMIIFTVLTQINLLFVPNAQDFASEPMKQLFSLTPRICFASLTAYLISNLLDTYIFQWLKQKYEPLWLRNNGSTMISQLVDSFLFTYLAFYGVFSTELLVELSLTTYAIKVVVAMCDTPFIYWARRIR